MDGYEAVKRGLFSFILNSSVFWLVSDFNDDRLFHMWRPMQEKADL